MHQRLRALHRWVGLTVAAFLFVSGLTGAVISWDHELDEWLNPDLYRSQWVGKPQTPLELANQVVTENPGVDVTYLPLSVEAGRTLVLFVEPKPTTPGNDGDVGLDAAVSDAAVGGSADDGPVGPIPDFNQVALNPVTGEVQARRMWGEPSLTRENLLPFLYKLHYSMHLPDVSGVEAGVLFMGVIAILWTLDSFVALAISFPSLRSWRKSFAMRWRQGGYRLLFDLHRSGGVWIWLLVTTVAVTSISMNLDHEVVRPIVNAISPLTPSPFDQAPASTASSDPVVSRAEILERARGEAVERGITAPAGGLFYSAIFGVYGVGYFEPGHDHGDGGLGNPWLYFDARSGEPVGADIPGTGSAGDLYMHLQFPLHSGRIAGVPGRVLVSLLGLAVATLSLTGVLIWLRKRAPRPVTGRDAAVKSRKSSRPMSEPISPTESPATVGPAAERAEATT